jgi:hypothetical protein
MTTADGTRQVSLGLTESTFRHDAPDQRLVSALEGYLKDVNPLTHLSVLDNTSVMPDLGDIVQRHGGTLQSLVSEGREGLGSAEIGSSLLSGSFRDPISEISAFLRHCTKLKELGVPLVWQHDSDVSDDLSMLMTDLLTAPRHLSQNASKTDS